MKKIEITFKGKTENYAYENNLDYEKAVKFCEKNGGTLPTHKFLWEEDKAQNKYRWELLYEQLKEDEELPWAWTSEEYDFCRVWSVYLATGDAATLERSGANSDDYALFLLND